MGNLARLTLLASFLTLLTTQTTYCSEHLDRHLQEQVIKWLFNNTQSVPLRRFLQTGNFEAFNSFLSPMKIRVPNIVDVAADLPWPLTQLLIDVTNMECFHPSLQDAKITFQRLNAMEIQPSMEASDIGVECKFDWHYKYDARVLGWVQGGGSADLQFEQADLRTSIVLKSPTTLEEDFPTEADVVDCGADFQIKSVDFYGSVQADIADTFNKAIKKTLKAQVDTAVCDKVYELDSTLDDMLKQVSYFMVDFLAKATEEAKIDSPYVAPSEDVILLDFTHENSFTYLMDTLRTKLNNHDKNLLRSLQEESGLGFLTNGLEMFASGILGGGGSGFDANKLIRSFLLDDNGFFNISLNDVPIFKGLDEFMHTEVSLSGLKILGLDSVSQLDVLKVVGPQKLQNTITIDHLDIEVDLKIKSNPTSSSQFIEWDKQAIGNRSDQLIKIKASASSISVGFEVYLGLDMGYVSNITLGTILVSEHIIDCFMGAIHNLQVKNVSAFVNDLQAPTIEGFTSPGINLLFNQAIQGFFALFKVFALRWIPLVFTTDIEEMINHQISNYFSSNSAGNSNCGTYDSIPAGEFVDWRDLLLTPEASKELGGSGKSPYGSLAARGKSFLDDQLSPRLNEQVIVPFTVSNSGKRGTLRFPNPMINRSMEVDVPGFGGSFEFVVCNTLIENLDSFGNITLFDPVQDEAYMLNNDLMIATTKPLRANATILVSFDGGDLKFRNEADVSVELNLAKAIGKILAKVDAQGFMNMSLGNALNPDCWIANVLPTLYRNTPKDRNFFIEDLLMTLQELILEVSCLECSIEEIRKLSVVNATRYATRALNYTARFLSNSLLQSKIESVQLIASEKCSGTANYDTNLALTNDINSTVKTELSPRNKHDKSKNDPNAPDVEEVRYYDFSLDNWINRVIGLIRDLVNTKKTRRSVGMRDLKSAGLDLKKVGLDAESFDLNTVIRQLLLLQDGSLYLPVDYSNVLDGFFKHMDLEVRMNGLRLTGLDTIMDINVLEVLQPQILQNDIHFGQIDAEVDLEIRSPFTEEFKLQNITLKVGVSDFAIKSEIFFGVDALFVEGLALGKILATNDLLYCAVMSLHKMEVISLNATFGNITNPTALGFRPDDLNEFVNDTLEAAFTLLQPSITKWATKLFAKHLKQITNTYFEDYKARLGESTTCSEYATSSLESFVDFRDLFMMPEQAAIMGGSGNSPYGTLVAKAKTLLYDKILAENPITGLSNFNDMVITPLTMSRSSSSGFIMIAEDVVQIFNKIDIPGLQGEFEFRLSDVYIQNLNSFGAVNILNPRSTSPFVLDNKVQIGFSNMPVRAGANLALRFQGPSINFSNEVDVTVVLKAAEVLASILAKVDSSRLMNFPLGDITNFYCWVSTIPAPILNEFGVRIPNSIQTAGLEDLLVTFDELTIDVDCVDCSSPKLQELSDMNATEFGRNVSILVENLSHANYTQVQIDRFLARAANRCPHRSDYDPNLRTVFESLHDSAKSAEGGSSSFLVALLIVLSCILIVVCIIVFFMRFIIGQKHKSWLESTSSEEKRLLYRKQILMDLEQKHLNDTTVAMYRAKQINFFVRVTMPFVVLGNICLFLSGHLSLGAAVIVELELAGKMLTLDNFFLFSMARSTQDMWEAGAQELAMFIILFSGVWPYTKQIVTFILWFCPPRLVTVRRRGKIYKLLDTLAKWSMVDIFVLVISLVAFRIKIKSPSDASSVFLDLYQANIMIVPMWGLYANMIAQLVSQISSHIILHYHTKIVESAKVAKRTSRMSEPNTHYNQDICPQVAETGISVVRREPAYLPLSKFSFHVPRSSKGSYLRVRGWVNYVIPVICLVIVVTLIVGCSIPTFQLEILGLLGIAVEFGQEGSNAVSFYSVINIVQLLFAQASYLNTASAYIGLGTLAIIFMITVLFVPVFEALLLMYFWYRTAPPDSKERDRTVWWLEILRAWQYVEVYLFSIIIATWQIGGISQFFFDDVVGGSMDGIFEALVNFGLIDSVDARLFYVSSKIQAGSYFLLVASFLLWIFAQFVSKADLQQRRNAEDSVRFSAAAMKQTEDSDCTDEELSEKLEPLKIEFTDCFRWLLQTGPVRDLALDPSMEIEDEDFEQDMIS